jgi:hypothetical protein
MERRGHPQEAQAVTFIQAYVLIGIPLIAIAMAGGALWLTSYSRRQLDRHTDAAE